MQQINDLTDFNSRYIIWFSLASTISNLWGSCLEVKVLFLFFMIDFFLVFTDGSMILIIEKRLSDESPKYIVANT